MARVTTEDCTTSIPNRFQLVIYACSRARELLGGSEPNVQKDNDKFTVVALREIADKKIDLGKTWLSIVKNAQKYQPVEETDIDEDQAVPLNENASEMSFDNFEKENHDNHLVLILVINYNIGLQYSLLSFVLSSTCWKSCSSYCCCCCCCCCP